MAFDRRYRSVERALYNRVWWDCVEWLGTLKRAIYDFPRETPVEINRRRQESFCQPIIGPLEKNIYEQILKVVKLCPKVPTYKFVGLIGSMSTDVAMQRS